MGNPRTTKMNLRTKLIIIAIYFMMPLYPIYASNLDTREKVHDATLKNWGAEHWPAMEKLINNESEFDSNAQNPWSTAYGIFQFLDKTWATVGCKKTTNVDEQIRCGCKYITQRYGNPTKAYSFHLKRGWY